MNLINLANLSIHHITKDYFIYAEGYYNLKLFQLKENCVHNFILYF